MASGDTKSVLTETDAHAVRLMLEKLSERDVTDVYDAAEAEGPIAELAAEAMETRNIDL